MAAGRVDASPQPWYNSTTDERDLSLRAQLVVAQPIEVATTLLIPDTNQTHLPTRGGFFDSR